MLEGRSIICLASGHWDSPTWVNVQHLMSRLAPSNRILYVEPISLRLPSIKKADRLKLFYRLGGWLRGTRRVRPNLWVYAPLLIPIHRSRLIRRLNRVLLRTSLRFFQKRLRLENPILWVFLPTGADLVGAFRESIVIYHCVDEYAANPGVDRQTIEMLERRLLRQADIVLTTSRSLYEEKKRYNRKTYYLPNAADVIHLRRALDSETRIPDDLLEIPAPRVGFIGAVSGYKIDIDLLEYAAARLPDVSFVFIGPVGSGDPGTDVSGLTKMANVHLMGPRGYATLPGYLKGLDACMIPFNINRITRSVFPMKFFEYLSPGKPIVATELPALSEYSDVCLFASGKAQFVERLGEALAESDEDLRKRRMELAEKHSWQKQLEDISRIVIGAERGRLQTDASDTR